MHRWTEEDVAQVRELYYKIPLTDIAEQLGVPYTSLTQKCYNLGLTHRKFYTEAEEKYIRDNYENMSIKDIARHLGRPIPSIKEWLRRNHEFKDKYVGWLDLDKASEMVGQDVENWRRYGLVQVKLDGRTLIDPDSMAKIMKEHPDLYNALECDCEYWEYYPFFHAKRLADRKRMCDERWNITA